MSPGPNWALIGDAAACINPLNGEGIDYGLETGRLLVDLLDTTCRWSGRRC
jgi:flavin-dependent dehydrogenase